VEEEIVETKIGSKIDTCDEYKMESSDNIAVIAKRATILSREGWEKDGETIVYVVGVDIERAGQYHRNRLVFSQSFKRKCSTKPKTEN